MEIPDVSVPALLRCAHASEFGDKNNSMQVMMAPASGPIARRRYFPDVSDLITIQSAAGDASIRVGPERRNAGVQASRSASGLQAVAWTVRSQNPFSQNAEDKADGRPDDHVQAKRGNAEVP